LNFSAPLPLFPLLPLSLSLSLPVSATRVKVHSFFYFKSCSLNSKNISKQYSEIYILLILDLEEFTHMGYTLNTLKTYESIIYYRLTLSLWHL
jgi:hypothetical protein